MVESCVKVASLLGASLLLSSATARAQSCTYLPVGSNEVWAGAAAWHGAESSIGDFSFDASIGGRGYFRGHLGVGGFNEERAPSSIGVLVGMLFGQESLRTCGYLRGEFLNYSFRNRYDLDMGKTNTSIGEVGGRAYFDAATLGPATLGFVASAGLAYRSLDVNGSRLVLREDVAVEDVHRITRDVVLVGGGGVQLRAGGVGGTVGMARRPSFQDRWVAFLRIGVALGQLEW